MTPFWSPRLLTWQLYLDDPLSTKAERENSAWTLFPIGVSNSTALHSVARGSSLENFVTLPWLLHPGLTNYHVPNYVSDLLCLIPLSSSQNHPHPLLTCATAMASWFISCIHICCSSPDTVFCLPSLSVQLEKKPPPIIPLHKPARQCLPEHELWHNAYGSCELSPDTTQPLLFTAPQFS